MSIHLFVDLTAAQGERQFIIDAFADLAVATRSEPGCVVFDLYATAADDNGLILVEEWTDQNAIDEHMKLEHTVRFFDVVRGRFTAPAVARTVEPVSI